MLRAQCWRILLSKSLINLGGYACLLFAAERTTFETKIN